MSDKKKSTKLHYDDKYVNKVFKNGTTKKCKNKKTHDISSDKRKNVEKPEQHKEASSGLSSDQVSAAKNLAQFVGKLNDFQTNFSNTEGFKDVMYQMNKISQQISNMGPYLTKLFNEHSRMLNDEIQSMQSQHKDIVKDLIKDINDDFISFDDLI